MAWTYSGDPANNARDEVRFLVGDIDTSNQQINDAEIAYLLAAWNNDAYISAAYACESIAGRFNAKADGSKSVGDLSISTRFVEQAKAYMERASNLRYTASRKFPPSPNWDVDGYPNTSEFSIGMQRNIGSGTNSVPPIQNFPD